MRTPTLHAPQTVDRDGDSLLNTPNNQGKRCRDTPVNPETTESPPKKLKSTSTSPNTGSSGSRGYHVGFLRKALNTLVDDDLKSDGVPDMLISKSQFDELVRKLMVPNWSEAVGLFDAIVLTRGYADWVCEALNVLGWPSSLVAVVDTSGRVCFADGSRSQLKRDLLTVYDDNDVELEKDRLVYELLNYLEDTRAVYVDDNVEEEYITEHGEHTDKITILRLPENGSGISTSDIDFLKKTLENFEGCLHFGAFDWDNTLTRYHMCRACSGEHPLPTSSK
jgi:hypothetical protein